MKVPQSFKSDKEAYKSQFEANSSQMCFIKF